MVIDLDDSTFESVLASKENLIIDFWAPWCGPCRVLSPTIEELASEETNVTFAKLNVDENPAVATRYGIRSLPSLLFMKNGTIVHQTIGVHSKTVIKDHINDKF